MKSKKITLVIAISTLALNACLNDSEKKNATLFSSAVPSSSSLDLSETISSSESNSPTELLSSTPQQSSSSFDETPVYTDTIVPYKVFDSNKPAIKRVVGYIPIYRDQDELFKKMNLSVVTHANLSFINPKDSSGDFVKFSAGEQWQAYKKHHSELTAKGIKVIASIGGAAANHGIYTHLLKDENKSAFVKNLVKFALDNKLDGIDVDLEGTLVNDSAQYGPFVSELSDSLKAHGLLLTAAVANWNGGYWSDATLAAFDFINSMSYDESGTWTPKSIYQHSPMSAALRDLKYWTETRGLAKEKVVLGVPFYGYNYTLTRYEIDGKEVGARGAAAFTWKDYLEKYPERIDADWAGKKLTADGIWFCNGRNTMRDKTLLSREYGGVMIWELSQDTHDSTSLMKVIVEHSGK
jgi:GH18 family chitinase